MARIAVVSLAVCALSVSGCTILAPQPDESHFFVLAPLPRSAEAAHESEPGALADTILGLGPIKLPPYLDRNEMAIRLTPNEVRYSPIDRWAEPLNVNVGRVLLQNLSLLLGTDRIVMYPWANMANIKYQVEVELLKFDVTKSGETELNGRYAILQGGTRQPLVVRQVNFGRSGATDTPAAAVAMSAILGDLSKDIALALRQLPPPQARPAAKRAGS